VLSDLSVRPDVSVTETAIRRAGTRLAFLGDFVSLDGGWTAAAVASPEAAWQVGMVAFISRREA
jgi:hypothetical protein